MVQIGLIALLVVAYVIVSRILKSSVTLLGQKKYANEVRITYVSKMLNLGFTAIFVLLVCLVLGIGYGQLAIFFVGVCCGRCCLVCSVVYFKQYYRQLDYLLWLSLSSGDWVKVVDKDDEILGQITEISSFHVIIHRLSGDVVTYPNSLILQKAVVRFENREAALAMSQFVAHDTLPDKVEEQRTTS